MGVMACDRDGCDNVMCNRNSNTYGYICNECFDELVRSRTGDIELFMTSSKGCFMNEDDIEKYEEEFRLEEF